MLIYSKFRTGTGATYEFQQSVRNRRENSGFDFLALSERDNRRDGDFGKRIVSNVAAQPPNKRGWAMATHSTILQLLSKALYFEESTAEPLP